MTSADFNGVFTSESVTRGHPDKVADQISDSILDALLKLDPHAKAAVETLVAKGFVVIAGEVRTDEAYVEIPQVVRDTIVDIGYDRSALGFDGNTCGVMVALNPQSEEIKDAVEGEEQGAGDQGLMFGYACNETESLMPMPIHVAHRLAEQLEEARRTCSIPWLRPDGKTQVTFEYENGVPVRLKTVLISAHHDSTIPDYSELKTELGKHVIEPALPAAVSERVPDEDFEFLVNPSGSFEVGGPVADAGLTGRKIIVDTYGGYARHGGGAFSGKDPSKVDRSASYAARWVAKNLVAAGASDRCEIQLAYAIGKPDPVSVMIETFGTGKVSEKSIVKAVTDVFDLTPAAIIKDLGLLAPIYTKTAAYGHFGREPEGDFFKWEQTDRVDDLRSALGL